MTFAGELSIVASAELGGLGDNDGFPVQFTWMVPSFAPKLLPWLALLALLAFPSNRRPAAWLVWVPLGVVVGAAFAVERALADSSLFSFLQYYAQVAEAAAFGLAALWLVGTAQARRYAPIGFLLSAFCLAAVGFLRVISTPAWEEFSSLDFFSGLTWYTMGFCLATGVAFTGGFLLTGLTCRRRYRGWKVALFLPVMLCALWMMMAAGFWLVVKLFFGESAEIWQFLAGAGFLALLCYLVSLPFLVLSFVSTFHCQRLKDLLRVRGEPEESALQEPPVIAAQNTTASADVSVVR